MLHFQQTVYEIKTRIPYITISIAVAKIKNKTNKKKKKMKELPITSI